MGKREVDPIFETAIGRSQGKKSCPVCISLC